MQVTHHTPQSHGTLDIRLIQWMSYLALAIGFFFIVDDLLVWLGLQLFQNTIAPLTTLALCVLLVPVLILWQMLITHWDVIDTFGTAFGCMLAGALMAFYTMHPPTGLFVLGIFGIATYLAFTSPAPRPTHKIIMASMNIAFVAMTVFISFSLHGHQHFGTAVRADSEVFYAVINTGNPFVEDSMPSLDIHQCDNMGWGCVERVSEPITSVSAYLTETYTMAVNRSHDSQLTITLTSQDDVLQIEILP
ncbi:MAG: hypothetical protein AAFV98_01305 [Chloroflexota bacterium]